MQICVSTDILNTSGQKIARYSDDYVSKYGQTFPTTYEQARELARQKYILIAGAEDLWSAVAPQIIAYGAGIIKMYQEITTNDIGYFANGWDREISMAFVKCFYDNGGEKVFGYPSDFGKGHYVHHFPSPFSVSPYAFIIQDYGGPDKTHRYCLIYNENSQKVFPVHGRILDKWLCNEAYKTYGAPTANEVYKNRLNGNKVAFQPFQKGQIIYDTKTGEFLENASEVTDTEVIDYAYYNLCAFKTNSASIDNIPISPPYIYSSSVSCKNVSNDQPSDITSTFSAGMEKVYVFTTVKDVRTKLVFKWEFYGNNSGMTVVEREMESAPDDGHYFSEVDAYSWLSLIPNSSYSVKIFINDGQGYEKVDEINFSVERKSPQYAPANLLPQEAKNYSATLILKTTAGDFTINLTGIDKDLKFWHTYLGKTEMISINNYLSGQNALKIYGCAGPINVEIRNLPQSIEFVEAANDAIDNYDRMWIIAKDVNDKPMLYQYQRILGLFANWCYWTNEEIGRFDGITALHYVPATNELWIAGYQTTEGGRNIHRLIKGKFEGAWERGSFYDDENFSSSLNKIVSIFSAPNGLIYILLEDGLKMRYSDGRWVLLVRPDSLCEGTFTCAAYNEGNDEIYIGSTKQTILRIDKDGRYPIRYHCGVDVDRYNQLNNRCNMQNRGISSDKRNVSYYTNKMAVYESYAQRCDTYAQKYSVNSWLYNYFKFFANYYRQNVASYNQYLDSLNKQIEIRQQQILNYQAQMSQIQNYKAIVEAIKVDSDGHIWNVCEGKISVIEGDKINENISLTTMTYMQSLMPQTPELLLRELERDSRFWNLQNVIQKKVQGYKRKVIIKNESNNLVILWAGEEFF